jgi:hypothetical protein
MTTTPASAQANTPPASGGQHGALEFKINTELLDNNKLSLAIQRPLLCAEIERDGLILN